MKSKLLDMVVKYLNIFPEECEKQTKLVEHLDKYDDINVIDWNNFSGHVVAGGFIYAKEDNKFLVLFHKDLDMYVYPGGHIDIDDINPLEAAKREIFEETGLKKIEQLTFVDDNIIPIDIDVHKIKYNCRLNLPEHYHFDCRYLFVIDKIKNIKIDFRELDHYKWVSIDELNDVSCYGNIVQKIKRLIEKK